MIDVGVSCVVVMLWCVTCCGVMMCCVTVQRVMLYNALIYDGVCVRVPLWYDMCV